MFCQKGVLKNFEKFTGKHLCQSYQISDHKHDIYFCRKLSTKLLAQSSNKVSKVSEVTVPKKFKQTLPEVEKVTIQKLVLLLIIKL